DSLYDDHKGILAFIRNYDATININEEVFLIAGQNKIKLKEIGTFSPELKPAKTLLPNEMGYLATGLKEPDLIKIGDTVSSNPKIKPLPGYREAEPVVFISFYPTGKTKFDELRSGFAKLRLSDAALSIEPESNEALGRGLKVGFLGQLHFEIISSRLASEFNLEFLTSFPSVAYHIKEGNQEYVIKQAGDFPVKPDKVFQPMIKIEILTPSQFMSSVMNLKNVFDLEINHVETIGENTILTGSMPLAELIRDFDDQLKSTSQGFASFSYEITGEEEADVEKMEILVANEVVPALTRIIPKKDLEREGRKTVEKLKNLLPKQQFSQAIQAASGGRIIARETLTAMKKDVTGYLYGGDRTRKMKLWKKQQRGKARLKETGRVEVPLEVFREILKK
ncbi:MAG: elongation factor 4, partial [bacterium]|nr:elongation factor 4 [bacterium]